jgi:hypothetical protein
MATQAPSGETSGVLQVPGTRMVASLPSGRIFQMPGFSGLVEL